MKESLQPDVEETIAAALELNVRFYTNTEAIDCSVFSESSLEQFKLAHKLYNNGNAITLTRLVGAHVTALQCLVSQRSSQKEYLDTYLKGKQGFDIQHEYDRFQKDDAQINKCLKDLLDVFEQLKTKNNPDELNFLVSMNAATPERKISLSSKEVLNPDVVSCLRGESPRACEAPLVH